MAANNKEVRENHCNNMQAMENHKDSLLPHLESFERFIQLPVVGAAWQQGQDVYEKVKGQYLLFFMAQRRTNTSDNE